MKNGTIIQVMGPVVDVRFEDSDLPLIKYALETDNHGKRLVMEVAEHIGDHVVRCILLDTAEGLSRGMEVRPLGGFLTVPVGEQTLGRMFNVLGDAIDGGGDVAGDRLPIHRRPPDFEEQSPVVEMLETGIKVIDLLAPYAKGGKIGLFGGAGVGKTVLIMEASYFNSKSRFLRLRPSAEEPEVLFMSVPEQNDKSNKLNS